MYMYDNLAITLLLPRGKWRLQALGLVSYKAGSYMMQSNASLTLVIAYSCMSAIYQHICIMVKILCILELVIINIPLASKPSVTLSEKYQPGDEANTTTHPPHTHTSTHH